MEYKNADYILQVQDDSPEVEAVVHKYDAFLDAITTDKFEHVREAIRQAVRFFASKKYSTTEILARENYANNRKMQAKYPVIDSYLTKIRIPDKKSVSIDLATGTGKSWVIYGVAQILLAEGFVEKVLILCPSLTIEEELKRKFLEISGKAITACILQELGALYPTPEIKSANDPILAGDICVENIHAVYERTGSSIDDSFKGKGEQTLVISDEVHHVYSGPDTRRWYEFLTNKDFGFKYLLGLTGTPYFRNNNDYFYDVIYRYGLKRGMEDGVIKTIDYKIDQDYERDENLYEISYANHASNQEKHKGERKPLSIVVTASVFECIKEWKRLVDYIAEKESLSSEDAAKKVIWVTAGLPANSNERQAILAEFPDAEKTRKENLQTLKNVDEIDNPVEWILSVAMLTEGWDVKNVFQIVPHSNKAFESKLLIAQVLGRGLRMPKNLTPPVQVIVNNHTRWTEEIKKLYEEVLEIENRVSWGYDTRRQEFAFPLFSFEYVGEQHSVESKKVCASQPTIHVLHPQERQRTANVIFSQSGHVSYGVSVLGIVEVDEAVRQIRLFLNEKDSELAEQWPLARIHEYITRALQERGYDPSFLSSENLAIIKQGFGPLFRSLGEQVPRIKLRADALVSISMESMPRQAFSENSIKHDGYLFYDDRSVQGLNTEERSIIEKYTDSRNSIRDKNAVLPEVQYLVDHLFLVSRSAFKTPLRFIYVSYGPERDFVQGVFNNSALFSSFIKSPDKDFYSIPYSYKPIDQGSTHVKRTSFNPDFFLVVQGTKDILVVEIKDTGDITPENKAKYRDASEHFEELNQRLEEKIEPWRYYFYFLSPENYGSFFETVRIGRYKGWKSELMQELES